MGRRKNPKPGSIGERILQIMKERGEGAEAFVAELSRIAGELKHEEPWNESKLSRVISGKQPLKVEEAVDIVTAYKQERKLDWLVLAIEPPAKAKVRATVAKILVGRRGETRGPSEGDVAAHARKKQHRKGKTPNDAPGTRPQVADPDQRAAEG